MEQVQQQLEKNKDKLKLLQQENSSMKSAKVLIDKELKQAQKKAADLQKEVPDTFLQLLMCLQMEKYKTQENKTKELLNTIAQWEKKFAQLTKDFEKLK